MMVSLTFHTFNRVHLLDFYESQQYETSEENGNAVLLSSVPLILTSAGFSSTKFSPRSQFTIVTSTFSKETRNAHYLSTIRERERSERVGVGKCRFCDSNNVLHLAQTVHSR